MSSPSNNTTSAADAAAPHGAEAVTTNTSVLRDKMRLCTLPIPPNRRALYKAYKAMRGCGWEPEEAKLTDEDFRHWVEELNAKERSFIENILAFFAVSDGLVNMNLVGNFMEECQALEVQYTWQFQAQMENVHAEVYARFIERFVTDETRRRELFGTLGLLPVVRKKTDWIRKYMNDTLPFGARLFAFVVSRACSSPAPSARSTGSASAASCPASRRPTTSSRATRVSTRTSPCS